MELVQLLLHAVVTVTLFKATGACKAQIYIQAYNQTSRQLSDKNQMEDLIPPLFIMNISK